MEKFGIIILVYTIALYTSCRPDYDISFPQELPFGTNIVFLDGELSAFENVSFYFQGDSINYLNIELAQNVGGEFLNELICTTVYPRENQDYLITDKVNFGDSNHVAAFFSQIYDEDLPGWEYKYCGIKEDYFRIEKFDTSNQTIIAQGKLRFKRFKKNGVPNGANIDKVIYVEFQIHDFFEIK